MRLLPISMICFAALLVMNTSGCAQESDSKDSKITGQTIPNTTETTETKNNELAKNDGKTKDKAKEKKMEMATFGGGCFWCTEAVFLQLKGVESVKSGYMGGGVDNPTYEMICTGTTGHAEVIHITYDPDVVSFDTLIQVFWKTHDPTTLNKQGFDEGTQYRSVVFFHNEEQEKKATDYKKKLNDAKAYPNPVITEITAASKLYIAEDYHQNFFAKNPGKPYCRRLIPPKLEKLKQVFGDKLKE